MKRSIALLLSLAFAAPVLADDWVSISSSNVDYFDAKAGSLERTTNKRGESIVALTIRVRSKATTVVEFERNYVTVADCESGSGTLWTVYMDGRVKGSNDFIFDGGSVASVIAKTICGVASRAQQRDTGFAL